jgi:hypothetical protein
VQPDIVSKAHIVHRFADPPAVCVTSRDFSHDSPELRMSGWGRADVRSVQILANCSEIWAKYSSNSVNRLKSSINQALR